MTIKPNTKHIPKNIPFSRKNHRPILGQARLRHMTSSCAEFHSTFVSICYLFAFLNFNFNPTCAVLLFIIYSLHVSFLMLILFIIISLQSNHCIFFHETSFKSWGSPKAILRMLKEI